jgi:hypothetical protein
MQFGTYGELRPDSGRLCWSDTTDTSFEQKRLKEGPQMRFGHELPALISNVAKFMVWCRVPQR